MTEPTELRDLAAEIAREAGVRVRTRRAELIREVYDRLNQANGYRRFDLAEG